MTNFFEKCDPWGRRYSLWVVVAIAFAAPLGWWSAKQIRLDNDVEKWLPENDSELRAIRWTHDQFPVEERVLLTWDGSSINDPRIDSVIEQLVGKTDNHGIKRSGLPYVSSVSEPKQALAVMQRNGIEPREAVRRLEGTIVGAGPLRLKLTETGRSAIRKTKRELQTAMRTKFGLELAILDASPDLTPLVSIPVPGSDGEAHSEPNPPAVLSVDGKLAETSILDHDLQVAWKGMRIGSESTVAVADWLMQYIPERGDGKPLVENVFFAPGSPVALSVGISEAGMADQAETLAAIRSACKTAGIPGESLHIAGAAVSSTELNSEIVKAFWDPSFPLTAFHQRSAILTSALIAAILAFAMIRNIRYAMMATTISLFATLTSLAMFSATGGSMNMVTIVMPTLVFILTMSGAIHLISCWKHTANIDESAAISETSGKSWAPGLFVGLMTCIGLISLCAGGLSTVAEFGFYAAIGVVLSFICIQYGLPSMMQIWPGRRPDASELEHAGWRFVGRTLTTHAGWQSLAVLAIGIGCGLGLMRSQTETKVIRNFPEQARITQDSWYIETSLSGTTPIETVIRFDQQAQKDTNFLDRMEVVRQIQDQIRIHPEISGSNSLADFQPVTERLAEDSSFLQRTKYNKRSSITQQRIRDGEVPNARSFYTIAEKATDLDEPGDAKLNQAGDELWRITAQVNVMTDNDVSVVLSDLHRVTQEILKLHPGSQHVVVGTLPLFVKTQKAIIQTLKSSSILACVLVLGVFTVMLRNIMAAFVATISCVMPVVAVFGVISWMNQRIDVGAIITISVGISYAATGMIYYLTHVRQAMTNGKNRHEAIVDSLANCGPALFQSAVISTIGMLALLPSELLLASRFGWILGAITGVSFIKDVVFVPQLLGGPIGWVFEPAKKKIIEPALAESPEVVIEEQAIPSTLETAEIPAPHIKPHIPASKKRRSGPRRESDTGPQNVG